MCARCMCEGSGKGGHTTKTGRLCPALGQATEGARGPSFALSCQWGSTGINSHALPSRSPSSVTATSPPPHPRRWRGLLSPVSLPGTCRVGRIGRLPPLVSKGTGPQRCEQNTTRRVAHPELGRVFCRQEYCTTRGSEGVVAAFSCAQREAPAEERGS